MNSLYNFGLMTDVKCVFSKKMLSGKTALITGANKGMGYQIARALALRNCKVIMADKDCQIDSRNEIVAETCNKNVEAKFLDLASLKSIRGFCNELTQNEKQLHILVNNAGVFCINHQKTCDGLDAVMQVNHLGPLLLTHLLTELLKRSGEGRILFVTSSGAFLHTLKPDSLTELKKSTPNILTSTLHYYNSKLCNMIATKMFAENLKQYNVTCNCLHPGMASTDFLVKGSVDKGYIDKCFRFLAKGVIRASTKNVVDAAGLAVFLATSDTVKSVSGKYFVNYQQHCYPKILEDELFCYWIWQESEKLLGINCDNPDNINIYNNKQ